MRGLRAPSSPGRRKPLSSSLPPLPIFLPSPACWPPFSFSVFLLLPPSPSYSRCSGSTPKLETEVLSLPEAQHAPTAAQT